MEMVIGMHDYYNSLAQEYYKKYCLFSEKYNKVSNNNDFDILEHSKEENREYFSSYKEKQKNAVIVFVFEAMALEAFINYYIIKEYDTDIFEEEYQGKTIWYKYKRIIKKVTGKSFEQYTEEYELFNILIKVRNALVHNESQVINLSDEDIEGNLNKMNKLIGSSDYSIFDNIDKVITTFGYIKKILV